MAGIDTKERLWTVAELADYLKVTRQSVSLWVSQGKIRSVKVGSKLVRIPDSAVQEFLGVRAKEG